MPGRSEVVCQELCTSLVMTGTEWNTAPPSSLVFQPKNQVASTCIHQESRGITATQQRRYHTSAPFSFREPGAN